MTDAPYIWLPEGYGGDTVVVDMNDQRYMATGKVATTTANFWHIAPITQQQSDHFTKKVGYKLLASQKPEKAKQ